MCVILRIARFQLNFVEDQIMCILSEGIKV
jgi:hypothetical protein